MRRRIRQEYTSQGGAWIQTNIVYYVYDGNEVVQERNANNVPSVTYTCGSDLSGSLTGAGGIGGLLARTDMTTGQAAFYHSDANGNVTMMVNSSNFVVAEYLYDAFGNSLMKAGILADANLYRFSGKEAHLNSGLMYYPYRYYDPNLQRWLNRDPIGESGFELRRFRNGVMLRVIALLQIIGGNNLFEFIQNQPTEGYDALGLDGTTPQTGPNSFACALATKNYQDAVNALHDKDDPTMQEVLAVAGLANAMRNACKPPSPPKPPTVPVPVPACPTNVITLPPVTEQQKQFCFWTTVGTVTYWVCSEVSRLFPPRNLIPIP